MVRATHSKTNTVNIAFMILYFITIEELLYFQGVDGDAGQPGSKKNRVTFQGVDGDVGQPVEEPTYIAVRKNENLEKSQKEKAKCVDHVSDAFKGCIDCKDLYTYATFAYRHVVVNDEMKIYANAFMDFMLENIKIYNNIGNATYDPKNPIMKPTIDSCIRMSPTNYCIIIADELMANQIPFPVKQWASRISECIDEMTKFGIDLYRLKDRYKLISREARKLWSSSSASEKTKNSPTREISSSESERAENPPTPETSSSASEKTENSPAQGTSEIEKKGSRGFMSSTMTGKTLEKLRSSLNNKTMNSQSIINAVSKSMAAGYNLAKGTIKSFGSSAPVGLSLKNVVQNFPEEIELNEDSNEGYFKHVFYHVSLTSNEGDVYNYTERLLKCTDLNARLIIDIDPKTFCKRAAERYHWKLIQQLGNELSAEDRINYENNKLALNTYFGQE